MRWAPWEQGQLSQEPLSQAVAVQGGGQVGAVCPPERHSKLASELPRLTDTSGGTSWTGRGKGTAVSAWSGADWCGWQSAESKTGDWAGVGFKPLCGNQAHFSLGLLTMSQSTVPVQVCVHVCACMCVCVCSTLLLIILSSEDKYQDK